MCIPVLGNGATHNIQLLALVTVVEKMELHIHIENKITKMMSRDGRSPSTVNTPGQQRELALL